MDRTQIQRTRLPDAFSSLSLPDFRVLLGTTVLTQLSGWMEEVARGWLVYELTHSAFHLSALAFVSGASRFLVAPIAGYVTDRMDRRQATALAEALTGVAALALGVLTLAGMVQLWEVYFLACWMGPLRGITMTTRQALLYDVVGPSYLTNAVGLNAVAANMARIAAPSLGGIIIGALGTATAFLAQAILLLLAIPVTLLLRLQAAAPPRQMPFWRSVVEGVKYVSANPLLLRLFLFIYIPNVLIYPYVNLIPVFADEVLGMGARGYGLLLTGVGFGSIPGGLIVAAMGRWRYKGMAMGGAALLYMGMVALFAQSRWPAFAFATLVTGGMGWSMMVSLNQTLVQLHLGDAFRGRGLSLYNLGSGLTPLGNLAMGGVAHMIGVPMAVTSFALAAMALSAAVGLASAQVRKL